MRQPETQKQGNRYFSCKPPDSKHNQFLTVTPSEQNKIKTDPLYSDSDNPVKTWALDILYDTFGNNEPRHHFLWNFHELPQEEGDRMQTMSDILNGCVTVEDLRAAEEGGIQHGS